MKRSVKNLVCLLIALCLFCLSALPAGAVSIDEGEGALRAQWKRGAGPTVSGYSLDYSYFEPAAAAHAKLPLFVFMAGVGEGTSPGEELTANSFCRWSSDEYQSRVTNAPGAYLLILRAPEPVYFDTCPTDSVHAAVADFAASHNVDETRIYVFGWCVGGNGAVRLVLEHTDFYAGVAAFSMRRSISEGEAAKLKNTAVWILGCTNDSYSIYSLYASPAWSSVKAAAADKSKVRFTSCTSAPDAGLLYNHHLWLLGERDYTDAASYYGGLKTVDGAGNVVEDPTFISWFTRFSRTASGTTPSDPGPAACTCDCHSSNTFTKIVWFIKTLIWRVTGNTAKRTCACGKRHW